MTRAAKPFTLTRAKARLGALCQQILKGRPVRITAKGEMFALVHVPRQEIVPFSDAEIRACYADPEEVAMLNRFGELRRPAS